MYKKYLPSIAIGSVAGALLFGVIFGLGRVVSLAMIAGIYLWYYHDQARKILISKIQELGEKLGLSSNQLHDLQHELKYLWVHYLLVGSVIYLLLAAADYLFANLLFLPLWPAVWILILGILLSLPELSRGDVFLGEKKLIKSDFLFMISLAIVFGLLVTMYDSPFYERYFFACVVGEGVWIGLTLFLERAKMKSLYTREIFVVWTAITLILAGVWLRNTTPQIQEALTKEKIVYQTGYIYQDCLDTNSISNFQKE